MKQTSLSSLMVLCMLCACSIFCSSCSFYRMATKAQGSTYSTKANSKRSVSLLWGVANNHQVIHTPVCDSLGVNGVSEVIIRKRIDDELLTIITLGIYSPIHIEWKCSKPCPPPIRKI